MVYLNAITTRLPYVYLQAAEFFPSILEMIEDCTKCEYEIEKL